MTAISLTWHLMPVAVLVIPAGFVFGGGGVPSRKGGSGHRAQPLS